MKGFVLLVSALRQAQGSKVVELVETPQLLVCLCVKFNLVFLALFEQFLEKFLPTVAIEQGCVCGGLEGEKQTHRQQHYGRNPHAEEHVEAAKHGHALADGGDDVVDDEKQYRNHHGQAQAALADDAAQGCADEEEDDAGDA